AKPQQRLTFRVDHRSPDLPVLDELAVFAVALGGITLLLDVLGAMAVRLAQLVEQGTMAGPHRGQLIEAPRGRVQQALSGSRLFLAEPAVPAEVERSDEGRERQALPDQ